MKREKKRIRQEETANEKVLDKKCFFSSFFERVFGDFFTQMFHECNLESENN